MTSESISQKDPNQAVYDHFLRIKHARPDYADFNDVPFSPDSLHNLDLARLPYGDDKAKTDFYVSLAPLMLAGEQNFTENVLPSVENIIDIFELQERLKYGSIIACFNHAYFADEPVFNSTMIQATKNKGIYSDWYTAADHSYTLVSRMIDVLGVEFTQDDEIGHASISYNGLRHIAHQIRTLPNSVNGRYISNLDSTIRTNHNAQTKAEINNAANQPGNILYVAGGGTHDVLNEDGTVMKIQMPARETILMLIEAGVPILYVAIKCIPTIKKGHLNPDNQTFIEAVALDEKPTGASIREGYQKIGQKVGKLLPGLKGFENLISVELE